MPISNTLIYRWTVPQGELSLRKDEEYYLELTDLTEGCRTRLSPTSTQKLPLDVEADKVSEIYGRYAPSIDNKLNVEFLTWAIPQEEPVYIHVGVDDSAAVPHQMEKGLFGFLFNKLEKLIAISFSPTAPEYRRVCKGLNFQGECTNKVCAAYKKVIYIQKGFGTFNIPKEKSKCECPNCKVKVDFKKILNLGFWDCSYTIDGKQIKPKEVEVNKSGTAPYEHYSTFAPGDNCTWEYLEIEVKNI